MLSIENRIALMARLGDYIKSNSEEWMEICDLAISSNPWFTTESIQLASSNLVIAFLDRSLLNQWIAAYSLPDQESSKSVGITMAGNIPMVGFHDLLCGFISGHHLVIRLSSKDKVLLPHLVMKLVSWEPEVANYIEFRDMLKGCDAYIATGSNNSARYFSQYFGKYPHIIRKNRTSVAVLNGKEDNLRELAKDVFQFFGLGCRNVTQLCVPRGYDFGPLLETFKEYSHLMDHYKYKNNYDYHLALYLLNRIPYLTNDSLLMIENELPFSPVSVLYYRYYEDRNQLINSLRSNDDIQCIVGEGLIPFGTSQQPGLFDYADGIDTMEFLCSLYGI